jgi:hypothetical protein
MSAANIILGATGGGGLLRVTTFTSSGTWTKQADVSRILVYVVGGGAGGVAMNTAQATVPGASGGTTSFGSHCSATGGVGGLTQTTYGTGINGDLNIRGSASIINGRNITISGTFYPGGIKGADSIFGGGGLGYPGSATNGAGAGLAGVFGGGGGGCGYRSGSPTTHHASGGQSGGCAIKLILSNSLNATETVTIGAGGAGGNSDFDGGAGGAGLVVIYEYGY